MEVNKFEIVDGALENVRLTPTGKISHAKTRVYTQRYRKDWEQMPDFKGWLTCVPEQPTRAYCLYCKKDLHAHRLSLLKHMCTMKHQRSALTYQDHRGRKRNMYPNVTLVSSKMHQDINPGKVEYVTEEQLEGDYYIVESLEEDSINCNEESRENVTHDENFEEINDDSHLSEDIEEKPFDNTQRNKVQTDEEEMEADTLEDENVEMIDDSDVAESVKHVTDESEKEEDTNVAEKPIKNELVDSIVQRRKEPQTARKSMNKVMIGAPKSSTLKVSSSKVVTIRSRPMLTNVKVGSPALLMMQKKPIKDSNEVQKKVPVESIQEEQTSSMTEANEKTMNKNSLTKTINAAKKTCISTHVVDTSQGNPISGLQVSLYKLVDGRWTFLNESLTSASGRCNDLVDHAKTNFGTGRYKLHFDVDKYFTARNIETMYPFIEIVFDVKNSGGQYHIPILLSPYGYTTYRGSEK